MTSLLRSLLVVPLVASAALAATGTNFHDHLGLQLWSLRDAMQHSEACGLDLTQITGVREVETAGTGKLTATQFAQELKARGLKAVGAHIQYAALKKDIAAAIQEARTLGVTYVICPWLGEDVRPHSAADARKLAAEFNGFGEACRAAGLKFGYHPHGYEFIPSGEGSDLVFDVLLRETKPELVCYEMDVFWIAHAGQDPVKLLARYPDRWRLMHVKDLRKGAPTGFSTGSAPATDNVAVGQGQLDWKAILAEAQKIGVEHYFLEDETPKPLDCIPASLEFLRALTW